MSFRNLLTNQIVVARLSPVSGSKTAFATVTTSLSVNIQQIADTKAVGLGGAVGKTYKMYAEVGVDLLDGDRLKDLDDGSIYQIMAGGINEMTLGNLDHLEIMVQKLND